MLEIYRINKQNNRNIVLIYLRNFSWFLKIPSSTFSANVPLLSSSLLDLALNITWKKNHKINAYINFVLLWDILHYNIILCYSSKSILTPSKYSIIFHPSNPPLCQFCLFDWGFTSSHIQGHYLGHYVLSASKKDKMQKWWRGRGKLGGKSYMSTLYLLDEQIPAQTYFST